MPNSISNDLNEGDWVVYQNKILRVACVGAENREIELMTPYNYWRAAKLRKPAYVEVIVQNRDIPKIQVIGPKLTEAARVLYGDCEA